MIKKVFGDLLPTMFAAMLYSLYAVIDGLFIGNATGDVGLAAINIVWPLAAIVVAIGVGIGTGGSVRISYYRGRREIEEAKIAYGTTCALLLICGVLLLLLLFQYGTILEIFGATGEVYVEACKYIDVYLKGSMILVVGSGILPILRNIGKSVPAMVCMAIGIILNIGLNYYMMFVLELGIQGAAYGTVIAQAIAVGLGILLLARDSVFGLYICMRKAVVLDIVKAGITPFGIYLAPSITLIFTNLQCLRYGGDEVVACYAVISYIVFPVLAMLGGVGDGTQPLISFYFGAQRVRELQTVKRIAHLMLVALSLITATISIACSGMIGSWFGLSQNAQQYFVVGMSLSAMAFFLQAFTKFNGAYLNATMQPGFAVCLVYAESLFVAPLMLYLLPMVLGVSGIWLAPFATAVIMLVIYEVRKKTQ